MPSKRCPKCKAVMPASEFQQHMQKHKHQERPPHWTSEGQQQRKAALQRDKYACRTCGRNVQQLKKLGLRLEVHHLDGDRNNISLGNLLSQCEECHDRTNPNRVAPMGGMPG